MYIYIGVLKQTRFDDSAIQFNCTIQLKATTQFQSTVQFNSSIRFNAALRRHVALLGHTLNRRRGGLSWFVPICKVYKYTKYIK